MASVRPHRDRFQVRWRVGTQERSQTFDSRREAQRFAARISTDLARGDYVDPRAGLDTVGQYAVTWMQLRGHLSLETQKQDRDCYRAYIEPVFGGWPVASVKVSDVEGWITSLRRAHATRGRALAKLRQILEVARRDNAIRSNPASDVRPPPKRTAAIAERPRRILSDAELATFLASADAVSPHRGAVVWVMGRAGLRIGEALALRRSDIDFAGGQLHVHRAIDGAGDLVPVKGADAIGRDGRTVPLPNDLAGRLRAHLEAQELTTIDGDLFVTSRATRIRRRTYRNREWLRTLEAADIGPLVTRDLRRTAAARLFTIDRWNVPEVQAFLGHSTPIVTLSIYAKVADTALPIPSDLGSQRVPN